MKSLRILGAFAALAGACAPAPQLVYAPTSPTGATADASASVGSLAKEEERSPTKEDDDAGAFQVSPALKTKLRTGLPVGLIVEEATPKGHVEVARCYISFDLWLEVYRVRPSPSPAGESIRLQLHQALRACAGGRLPSGTAKLSVREA